MIKAQQVLTIFATRLYLWHKTITRNLGYGRLSRPILSLYKGPSIKYVTLEGEEVREGVTVCDRGRGVKSMWRHAYTKFIIHMKHEI